VKKNVSGQKIAIYAYNPVTYEGVTGDGLNISAQIFKDGGAAAATDDTNPTELDSTNAPGIYLFDITQAESNADLIILYSKSTTSNVKIDPITIYTIPELDDTIASIGTITGFILEDTIELQNDWANGGRLDSIIDAIKTKTDNLPEAKTG